MNDVNIIPVNVLYELFKYFLHKMICVSKRINKKNQPKWDYKYDFWKHCYYNKKLTFVFYTISYIWRAIP